VIPKPPHGKYARFFDDNVLLVNPTIDCSDKEMHQRNGFKTNGDNVYNYFKNNDQALFIKEVFRPS